MVNEDSHSTGLSVQDEEGHRTILLAPSLHFLVLKGLVHDNAHV